MTRHRSPRRRLLASLALALVAATVLFLWRALPAPPRPEARRTLAQWMGGVPPEGFRRALPPAAIQLPRDHGVHPAFRTEWWYFTGNLETVQQAPGTLQQQTVKQAPGTSEERFGFQLTFFRSALAPPRDGAPPVSTPWATEQMFMAHFALSDIDGGRFHPFERFARGAVGVAGVEGPTEAPFRVWVGPWSVTSLAREEERESTVWPLRLQARATDPDGDGEAVAIDLVVTPTGPVVRPGKGGYSRKGRDPGNASYYYSFPRLETRGSVTVGGRPRTVRGTSWLDREWSTSALGAGQVGWDWFALHLDDGRAVMFYQLRREDGRASAYSAGTLVAADGTAQTLGADDVTLTVLDRWTAPDGGAVYPARWRLEIAAPDGEALQLEVRPLLADQELHAVVRYWEGAVAVTGTRTGRGYVELTGYASATAREGGAPVR